MSKYGARKKKIEYPVGEESATDQVNELLEYYDIDIESIAAGEGDRAEAGAAALEKALDYVMRAFRQGVLTIERNENSKLEVHQTIQGADPLIYSEIGAKAKIAMEKFSPDAGYSRIYAFMGSLCGIGKAGIEKLSPKDLAVVETLGSVFSNA